MRSRGGGDEKSRNLLNLGASTNRPEERSALRGTGASGSEGQGVRGREKGKNSLNLGSSTCRPEERSALGGTGGEGEG